MLLRPRPSTVLDRFFYKLVQPSIVRDDQAVPPSVTSLTRAILRLIIMCTYSPNRPTSRTKGPYHLLAVLYETMLLLIDVGWRTHACSPSPHACRALTHAALVDATSLVMRITPACIPRHISRLVADLVSGFQASSGARSVCQEAAIWSYACLAASFPQSPRPGTVPTGCWRALVWLACCSRLASPLGALICPRTSTSILHKTRGGKVIRVNGRLVAWHAPYRAPHLTRAS